MSTAQYGCARHDDELVEERSESLVVHLGSRELVIRQRYEVLSSAQRPSAESAVDF